MRGAARKQVVESALASPLLLLLLILPPRQSDYARVRACVSAVISCQVEYSIILFIFSFSFYSRRGGAVIPSNLLQRKKTRHTAFGLTFRFLGVEHSR